ncbi:helix-turn-helix domain-containing protein [Pseudonocardia sp. GCM10023141]|uniref:helix-turn-helix domain-containing protein n=1 Tax=Pseudonocardia sp. GCM10023141 TaxID=3252653 RepID=UPI00360F472F
MAATPTVVTLYKPAEVAAMLRCSTWWIKEQARRGRIPFSWIGGSYLFTRDHIAEIVAIFESRPDGNASISAEGERVVRARRKPMIEPKVRLTARTPRRVRSIQAGQVNAA